MNIKKRCVLILLLVILLVLTCQNAFAAFFITGFVFNATDGTDANGYNITMYNTAAGPSDNVTDLIGPGGVYNDAGNYYVLDCEALTSPCQDGDNLTLVILEHNKYTSETITLLRSGLGFTQAPNMTLYKTLPPSVIINAPANSTNVTRYTAVNATVANVTFFPVDEVILKIGNATGNFSAAGELGSHTSLYQDGEFYNITINTLLFSDGWYDLWVVANNTKGDTNHSKVTVYFDNAGPELEITSNNIAIDDVTPIETQSITINATILNKGLIDAINVTVQFFKGNYSLGKQIGSNHTTNITAGANVSIVQTWNAVIGNTDIYVVVDPPLDSDGNFEEVNESNNYAFKQVNVSLYHIMYGEVTGNLMLSDSAALELINWNVTNTSGSNIYIADSDSSISFSDLVALSRNTTGSYFSDDFQDADALLNMTNLTNSINRTYTVGGNPINTDTFTIFGKSIANVPIINSTNSSNFVTGILWDSSDDDDSKYDTTDQEDLVFVTKVNPSAAGYYGVYDYEISIPANLRKYVDTTETSVSIYAEIR